jgi:hypothetical protein
MYNKSEIGTIMVLPMPLQQTLTWDHRNWQGHKTSTKEAKKKNIFPVFPPCPLFRPEIASLGVRNSKEIAAKLPFCGEARHERT